MMARRWTIWAVLVVVLAAPAGAWAVPSLTFFWNPLLGANGGTLSYGGTDGVDPLVGSSIKISEVFGLGTPTESGTTLFCDPACTLSFTTGPSITEGAIYTWAAGGTFTITGNLETGANVLVASGTLLTGSFDTTITGLAGPGILVTGFGTDAKDPDLLAFYGIGNTAFEFSDVELAGPFAPALNGSFSTAVTTVQVINTAAEPGQLLLLGVGLAGVGILARRRMTGNRPEGR
jgi:hypothetical protein